MEEVKSLIAKLQGKVHFDRAEEIFQQQIESFSEEFSIYTEINRHEVRKNEKSSVGKQSHVQGRSSFFLFLRNLIINL